MAFYHTSIFLDYPPMYLIIPFFPPDVSPIFLIGSAILFGYALLGLVDGITAYYNQEHICTIHRGRIEKNASIYYCPSCTTPYCSKCYEQVIKKDGCWNCGHGVPEKEDEGWKSKKEGEEEKFDIIHKKEN